MWAHDFPAVPRTGHPAAGDAVVLALPVSVSAVTPLDIIAYLADIAILATYAATAKGRAVRWFHLANAIGCFPVIGVEVVAGAWPPLVLTAAFGVIGSVGFFTYQPPVKIPSDVIAFLVPYEEDPACDY